MMILNYRNESVPVPALQDIVKVWQITPHQSSEYTDCLVMGWKEMLDIVRDTAESLLERNGSDENGIDIKVKLIDMEYGEYLEAFDNPMDALSFPVTRARNRRR